MTYELLIQKDGAWLQVDLGDDTPYMVFQVNNLNDLKDINASYSQSLSIPKSPRNCELFDYLNMFEAESQVPYGVYQCVLYCDGAQLIPDGYKLVVISTDPEYFKCQIVSHASGLFTTLGTLSMEDLDLPTIPYTIDEIQASVNGLRDYVFAIDLAYKRNEHTFLYGFRDGTTEALRRQYEYGLTMVNAFWPYFNLLKLITKIFEAQGYSINTPITEQDGYKDAYISLADMKPGETSFDPLKVRAAYVFATSQITDTPLYMFGDGNPVSTYGQLDTTSLYDPEDYSLKTKGKCFTATDNCTIKITINCTSPATSFRVLFRIRKYGIVVDPTTPATLESTVQEWEDRESQDVTLDKNTLLSNWPNGWISDEINLYPGEKVYIEANLLECSIPVTTMNLTLFVDYPEDSNKTPAGGIIYPGQNFEFKTQLEVVKLFTQLHGLTVIVDSDTNTVNLYPTRTIIDNALSGNFMDWTDKLVEEGAKVEYTLDGYAQYNTIQYSKNDDIEAEDSGVIEVNNKNITFTKDMISLAVKASEDRETLAPVIGQSLLPQAYIKKPAYTADSATYIVYIAYDDEGQEVWPQTSIAVGATLHNYIPQWEYSAPGTYIAEIVDIATRGTGVARWPRIGMLPYNNLPPASALKNLQNAKGAQYIPVQHFIDTYYKDLQDHILYNVRRVTEYFNLSPEDIHNIDLFKPVYLEKYGQYFYIQNIENYNAGKLTKVNLVAIKLD